ncbi:MAG: hypothetical protein C4334_05805 [Pyrinomonas sp.]|uniref:class I SAM-dependent rRNA methyltransferase n=1 Tax=Pyrinomonas sp. TaxID=2080306 RepID=UPI0033285A87
MSEECGRVVISARGAAHIRAGHLWVYRSELRRVEAEGGAVVRVTDVRGRVLGRALYSDRSEIALRLLTLRDERVDRDWWQRRLRAAFKRRVGLAEKCEAYRLVYAEGDLLPSLIVDRYHDVLVLQTLAQATDALKGTFVELLVEEFSPRAIIERNDVRVRELEGLEMRAGVLYGEDPGEVEIVQHGTRFRVSPLGGQKTGAFLDQRENHLAARRYACGRALDCFTFNGAFALNVAPVCDSVIGLDISEEAVLAARRNAELNEARNVEFRVANVFDALREFEARGERFDTIVLDPPAFAKNRASLASAMRGYKEINLRAFKLLAVGGVLITCTCSYHVDESLFGQIVADAAADARRRVQIAERRMQSGDHPVLVGMPETFYLKCLVLRVIE